jgi:hypothetical protein
VLDAQGRLAGLRWLIRDVTERKHIVESMHRHVTKSVE